MFFFFFFFDRTEKEKDVLRREGDDAKAALDGLARDKVSKFDAHIVTACLKNWKIKVMNYNEIPHFRSCRFFQAAAEKTIKSAQGVLTELNSRLDEGSRSLNDADAAKKKLTVENSDLLRQLEEAENQINQLSKIKASLSMQLEENKKMAEEESRVSWKNITAENNKSSWIN